MNEREVRRALVAMKGMYNAGEFIGNGSYGIVYEVFSAVDGTPFAAKFILPTTPDDTFMSDDALRELRATTGHTPSPHLMTFRQVLIFDNFTVCFIMKRYDCTLHALMKAGRLERCAAKSIFLQLVTAVGALHAAGTCHRDLKPENILVDFEDGSIVLADLGVAKDNIERGYDRAPLTGHVATCGYAPVETLLPTQLYTISLDIWSLGVVLFELLVGKMPFPACEDRAAHAKVIMGIRGIAAECERCREGTCADTCPRGFLAHRCLQEFGIEHLPSRLPAAMDLEGLDADTQALILRMLNYIPAQRPGIDIVASAAFLSDFKDTRAVKTAKRPRPTLISSQTKHISVVSSRPPLRVIAAFEPRLSTFCAAASSSFPSWLGCPDCSETRSHLFFLLDSFLYDELHADWCLEAWLLAMAASRILARPVGERIECLAAYITYGLALASPTMSDPHYSRYSWVDRLPVRVLDVVYVAREEAAIVAELCGSVPRVDVCVREAAFPTARHQSRSEIREFCTKTILGTVL